MSACKKLSREQRVEKYGRAWRYVYLLEQELGRRKTRQSFIRSSVVLNVMLAAALIYFAAI